MSKPPRYYLYGFSPQTVLSFPFWFPALAYFALVVFVMLFIPPSQQSDVANKIGRTVGTVMVMGWSFVAIHLSINLIAGWIFALCYLSIAWLFR